MEYGEFLGFSLQPAGRGARGHGQALIRIRRSSGKSFKLAAPRDVNGPDPQLKAKLEEIRAYWAKAQGQTQTSGRA